MKSPFQKLGNAFNEISRAYPKCHAEPECPCMGDFDVKNKARHEQCLPKISKSEKGERFLRPRDSRLHAKPTRTNRRFNNGNCHSVLTLAHAWSCARTEPDLRLTGNNMQLSISRRITRSGFAERQIAPGDFVEEYRPELCKAHARRYGETQVRLTHLANQDGACGPILKSGDIFAKTPGMRREHGCASAGGSCFR